MEEREYYILEINLKTLVTHIREKSDNSNPDLPNWKNLGEFFGTWEEAEEELGKRVEEYKKRNFN
jgi:hypothetical protein